MLYDSIGKKQTQHYTNTEVDRFSVHLALTVLMLVTAPAFSSTFTPAALSRRESSKIGV
jgi:hypothetical protein